MHSREDYFSAFRDQIVGHHATFASPYGMKQMIYADWAASGRLYRPIERQIQDVFGPFVGNTHSFLSHTGAVMTDAYHIALKKLKQHVGADDADVILATGSGSTSAINKLQRILGLRIHERYHSFVHIGESKRPVVFLTHMEHHSNHTSWLETIAEVVCLAPNQDGLVDPNQLAKALHKYQYRPLKIGSFTACSNVTGIQPPLHELAELMHRAGGFCFADFATAAPYVEIQMHPKSELERLDAIFYSPHKFLGGPGSPGILVFNSRLYQNRVPDHPGGGTVEFTNPWKVRRYVQDIEAREDGGTPSILQTIKAALCVELKAAMSVRAMAAQEAYLTHQLLSRLDEIPGIVVLAGDISQRLGVVSFVHETIHYNLIVKLLNDKFGIQTRGGCSCAGTYGHYLLGIDRTKSKKIENLIATGIQSSKPGWVRISLHPTMTQEEVSMIADAVEDIVKHASEWQNDYVYSQNSNDFYHKSGKRVDVNDWFELPALD